MCKYKPCFDTFFNAEQIAIQTRIMQYSEQEQG